jgi:hypothetical protein
MDINKLVSLIDAALTEADNVADKSKYYSRDTEPISSTKKVLSLLKQEVINNPENISQRILRAMHDLGMATYKEFENTTLEKAINDVTEILYNELPDYKILTPLRGDFGKGDPI